MTTRNGRMLAALMTGAVLAGCGGGGSDGGNNSTTNHAPGADAGADITRVEGASFTLTGKGTDTDGDALTFAWTVPQGFATGAKTSAALSVSDTPDIDANKTYTFTLKVTDSHGESATDNVTITLTAIPPETVTLGFDAVTNAAPGLAYISGSETVSGLTAAAAISISGANCEYSINDGAFTATAGTVSNNQAVRVKAKAADAFETASSCTLTVGDVTADFAITTGANAFDFAVEPGKLVFNWHAFSGITRYELTRHNSATDETAFVDDDIAGDSDSYEHRISVHLTDWINDRFMLSACNDAGCVTIPEHEAELVQALSVPAITKIEPSNWGGRFGDSIALSGDLLVVGASTEGSAATGINGDATFDCAVPQTNCAPSSGAVYVFSRDESGLWQQEAYLKASNTHRQDYFGSRVAISGNTVAVGAFNESSAAASDGNAPSDCSTGNSNCLQGSGAVYLFQRSDDGEWHQQAFLKASNADVADRFGEALALFENTLVVGAARENGNGVDGPSDNTLLDSGAAYVFTRDEAGTWNEEAYLKAEIANQHDTFGSAVALYGDTLVIGSLNEDSAATGINGNANVDCAGNTNCAMSSGAAYIFERDSNGSWSQSAYLKASDSTASISFGTAVAAYGSTVAVGARDVYVFKRDEAGVWSETAILQTPYDPSALALSENALVAGQTADSAIGTGVGADDAYGADYSGAAYLFRFGGTGWSDPIYIKGPETMAGAVFGLGLSLFEETLVIGSPEFHFENKNGAIYVY